jgi:drug/metabolite transporter (DMT)-like permease
MMTTDLVVAGLAIFTAAGWGATAPLSKLGMERGGTPMQVSITVIAVSVVVYWIALVAQGTNPIANAAWVLALFALTGTISTAAARLISYIGIQRVGASVNSAGINTRPVWSTVLAVIVLGETVTVQGGIGIVVVVVGLIAIAFSGGGDLAGWELPDLAFPLVAAVSYGAGNVARRYGLTATDVSALEAVAINETAGLIGLLAYAAVYRRGDLAAFRSAPRIVHGYFIGCGLLSAVALFALFEALNRGRVVVVDPLSNPTSLFAILFTALLLGDVERVTGRLVAGAALVVVGVVLITGPSLV